MCTALHILPLATHANTHTHTLAMLPYLILFKSCGKRCTQATDAHMHRMQTKNDTTFSYEKYQFPKVQDVCGRRRMKKKNRTPNIRNRL